MSKTKKFEGQEYNYKPIQREQDLMSDSEYLKRRVDNQIDWHKRKSELNRKKYGLLKNVDAFVAALVPVSLAIGTLFPTLPDGDHPGVWITRAVSAFSGVYVAISTGFFELEGYETNAKNYERLYKKLETEKYKYLSRAEPYDEEDAFPRLIFTTENYLHQDMMSFFKSHKKGQQKKPKHKTQKQDIA